MQPIPQGHGRSLRLASVLLALLVLLAVVAIASGTGFGHRTAAAPAPAYISWAMSVFLVLFALMTPFAIYAYVLQARERLERRATKSFQARVLRSFAFLFILAIVYVGRTYFHGRIHLTGGFHQLFFGHHFVPGKRGKNGDPAGSYTTTFQWPVLWATIAALLAAGGAWLWWRRTHVQLPATVAGAPTMEEDVASSIDDAIDDLEAEPDARRAVIAAYARMEAVFGRHGLRRAASETPTEYLRRILLGLTSQTDAVSRLTVLFEQAKFSAHAIDGRMKEDAITALRAIRDDLHAAPA